MSDRGGGKEPRAYRCAGCGRETDVMSLGCPGCMLQGGWIRQGGGRGACLSSEIVDEVVRIGVGDPDVDKLLNGGAGRGGVHVVVGGPGVGKSTKAALWAGVVSLELEGSAMVVCWESAREISNEAVKRSGAPRDRIFLTERYDWEVEANALGVVAVVLDSVSARGGVQEITRANEWASEGGRVVFALAQVTSEGTTKGGPGVEHWGSASIFFTPHRVKGKVNVEVRKCRWALGGQATVEICRPGV